MAGNSTDIKDIKSELERRRKYLQQVSPSDLIKMIDRDGVLPVIQWLLFYTSPVEFIDLMNGIREEAGASKNVIRFFMEITIDIQSFLPNWNLKNSIFHKDILDDEALGEEVIKNRRFIDRCSKSCPDLKDGIIAALRIKEGLRLKAEGIDNGRLDKESEKLVGNSLNGYIDNVVDEIKQSNLLFLSRVEDVTGYSEWGNDYAQFLWQSMRLGASFVTTNPVLVKLSWDNEPDIWNEEIDRIVSGHINSRIRINESAVLSTEDLTRKVVLENALLLRGIFLLTEGNRGYVTLQVSPENHNDAESMVGEARRHYGCLKRELNGVPNVVFKLPGTLAGLRAAESLTNEGIGVAVTVNFSLFQSQPFAEIINKGHALVSYLAVMNGRLAHPVRDELIARNISRGAEAAQWSAVAVTKKIYRRLYASKSEGGLGLDPKRIKILVASLRNYEGFFPDISEVYGVPAITIFPNIRRQFDEKKRHILPDTILENVPDNYLEILGNSEIFKEAFYLPEDGDEFKPRRALTLEQEETVIDWTPVKNTLEQFKNSYNEMIGKIKNIISENNKEGGICEN